MSNVELHFLFNHAPVFLPLVGVFVYLWGILRRVMPVERVGLFLILLGGLSSFPAQRTGDASEHEIRSYPCRGLLVEAHEEAAEKANYLSLALGFVGVVVLVLSLKGVAFAHSVIARLILVIFTFVTFGFMANAAHLGGKIGHEELQPNWKTKDPAQVYCP